MPRRKICVVTGSRAEYGLLYWVLKGIQEDADLELQIIVTGMHLSPEFGSTWQVIEQDGFTIDAKVEMLLSSDTPVGIAKSIGLGVIGFADALDRLRPDILLLLGDRFEIMAAAQAAMVARIPIAHIAGGDTTEGAFDEAIRHSITKMSHIHFITNEGSAHRVRQLGEDPEQIHLVGNPGLDHLRRLKLLSREELERDLEFKFRQRNLDAALGCAQLEQLPEFLERKRLLAERYRRAFADVEGVRFFCEPDNCRSNYWLNVLLLDDNPADERDNILDATNGTGIMTRPAWTAMHRLPMFVDCPRMDLSVTESLERRLINIPSSTNL